jgi:hypothetical protein
MRVRWFLMSAIAIAAACTSLPEIPEDTSAGDAEAGPPGDAPTEPIDDAGVDVVFHDLSDTTRWQAYDLTNTLAGVGEGFIGGAFDGRYVYFVPSEAHAVMRYDTTHGFMDPTSWEAFRLSDADAATEGYAGAAFDGKYVYLAPVGRGGAVGSLALRFDTTSAFGDASSWVQYDVKTSSPDAGGLATPAFDGRYVTFIASYTSFVAATYDTQAPFTDAGSWSLAAMPSLGFGATIVGDTTYAPISAVGGVAPGVLARAGTTGTWTNIVPGGVATDVPMTGALAVGDRVFFFPGAPSVPLTVLDTTKPVNGTAAWTTFDLGAIDAGATYTGGTFDGRYVYVVPRSVIPTGAPFTVLARFDTAGSVKDPASWSRFDLGTLPGGSLARHAGAVFDGRYVYLVPNTGTVVLRFDAREPAAPYAGPARSFL